MTDDLVVRLRCYPANRLCRQVADALEAKNARIAELTAALKPFAVKDTEVTPERRYYDMLVKHEDRVRARAALGEKHDNE